MHSEIGSGTLVEEDSTASSSRITFDGTAVSSWTRRMERMGGIEKTERDGCLGQREEKVRWMHGWGGEGGL